MAFIILAQVGHLEALGGSLLPLQNSPKSPKEVLLRTCSRKPTSTQNNPLGFRFLVGFHRGLQ